MKSRSKSKFIQPILLGLTVLTILLVCWVASRETKLVGPCLDREVFSHVRGNFYGVDSPTKLRVCGDPSIWLEKHSDVSNWTSDEALYRSLNALASLKSIWPLPAKKIQIDYEGKAFEAIVGEDSPYFYLFADPSMAGSDIAFHLALIQWIKSLSQTKPMNELTVQYLALITQALLMPENHQVAEKESFGLRLKPRPTAEGLSVFAFLPDVWSQFRSLSSASTLLKNYRILKNIGRRLAKGSTKKKPLIFPDSYSDYHQVFSWQKNSLNDFFDVWIDGCGEDLKSSCDFRMELGLADSVVDEPINIQLQKGFDIDSLKKRLVDANATRPLILHRQGRKDFQLFGTGKAVSFQLTENIENRPILYMSCRWPSQKKLDQFEQNKFLWVLRVCKLSDVDWTHLRRQKGEANNAIERFLKSNPHIEYAHLHLPSLKFAMKIHDNENIPWLSLRQMAHRFVWESLVFDSQANFLKPQGAIQAVKKLRIHQILAQFYESQKTIF